MKKLENHYYYQKINEDEYFIFHSTNGEPFIVTSDIFKAIEQNNFNKETQKELEEVNYFKDDRVYLSDHKKTLEYIDNYSGPNVLDLVISESCNLACHMCSHAHTTEQSEERNLSSKILRFEDAKKWIDYYVDYYPKIKKLNRYIFHYGAAEPLINKKGFFKILEYIDQKTRNKDVELEQLVNTNLTLLDDEVIEYLVKYNVKVSVGLDGLKEQNDSIRITKRGEGTFNTIINNIKKLLDRGVSVGVALTLTDRNFEKVDPHKFLSTMKNIGVGTVLVDSDFINHINYSGDEITNKLMTFWKIGENLDIEIIGSWRTPFSNMTTENDDEPKSFCTSLLGKNLTVTPSKCLTFCTYSGEPLAFYSIDDIDAGVKQFIEQMKLLMNSRLPTVCEQCKDCPIEGHCSGGCYLTYEVTKKKHSMCDIYLSATKKLIQYKYTEQVI